MRQVPWDGSGARQVASCMSSGGVALLPTDTVYGLAAHPLHGAAIDKIFDMKRRPRARNLPVMVSSVADIERIGCEISAAAERLFSSEFFPGPLTLALGLRAGAAPGWLKDRDEVAVRIPDDEFLVQVARYTGPFLMTSANLHSAQPRESVGDILPELAGAPDVIVDGGPRATVASTLVNCRLIPPAIERVGAVPAEDVEKILL